MLITVFVIVSIVNAHSTHVIYRPLTFLGRTLGMSNEYLSTLYDSVDGHMVATTTTTKTSETGGMTLLRQWLRRTGVTGARKIRPRRPVVRGRLRKVDDDETRDTCDNRVLIRLVRDGGRANHVRTPAITTYHITASTTTTNSKSGRCERRRNAGN